MEAQAPPRAYTKKTMLTVRQIVQRLNCSRSLVYQLIDNGTLEDACRYGGSRGIRVPEESLEKFLRARKIEVGL